MSVNININCDGSRAVLKYVAEGIASGCRIIAFGAGMSAIQGGDGAFIASSIAVASSACAVLAQVVLRRLVKSYGALVSVEDQLLGAGSALFFCSAFTTVPVASIGGTVCVGLSFVIRCVRCILDYYNKDEPVVERELSAVMVKNDLGGNSVQQEKRKREFLVVLFGIDVDIASAENKLCGVLLNILGIKKALRKDGFSELVDVLTSLMTSLTSEVTDAEDQMDLKQIERLLELQSGGVLLRKLQMVEDRTGKLKEQFAKVQEVVSEISDTVDRNRLQMLVVQLKQQVNILSYESYRLWMDAKLLLELVKDKDVLDDCIKQVMMARELVKVLIDNTVVGGKHPNLEAYYKLKDLDRQLVEYLKKLQDLHKNQLIVKMMEDMFEETEGVRVRTRCVQQLVGDIRIPSLQYSVRCIND